MPSVSATALHDSRPTVVLTTSAAAAAVEASLEEIQLVAEAARHHHRRGPRLGGGRVRPVDLDVEDISHLQYTSGSTRPPVGVEITHRAVGTNLVQMILSIDLLDRNTHGVSWLPLYHDMGLSMIGFPAVYGGHSTLMSPTAFIRRPQRWIHALSDGSRHGRVVTAAPNFAYEYTAQRGLPAPGDDVDLSNVVLIIGSEPVSMQCDRDLQCRVRAVRVAADGDQTVVWHRRGDAVRVDHRTDRRADRRPPRPGEVGEPARPCASRRTPPAPSRTCRAVR